MSDSVFFELLVYQVSTDKGLRARVVYDTNHEYGILQNITTSKYYQGAINRNLKVRPLWLSALRGRGRWERRKEGGRGEKRKIEKKEGKIDKKEERRGER